MRAYRRHAYLTVSCCPGSSPARIAPAVTPATIESLFVDDLAYLQDFYQAINFGDHSEMETQSSRPLSGRGRRFA